MKVNFFYIANHQNCVTLQIQLTKHHDKTSVNHPLITNLIVLVTMHPILENRTALYGKERKDTLNLLVSKPHLVLFINIQNHLNIKTD